MHLLMHVISPLLFSVSVMGFTSIEEPCSGEICDRYFEKHDHHYTRRHEEDEFQTENTKGNADKSNEKHESHYMEERRNANFMNNVFEPEVKSDFDKMELKSNYLFEFPKIHRVDPGEIGDEVEIELEPGRFFTRITKAIQPPVFVIPNFLSDEECDHIIQRATANGMNVSNLFGAEIEDEFSNEELDRSDITRISEQTFLTDLNLGTEFSIRLQKRVSQLTELPELALQLSEAMQVVSYTVGGHYHAHLDTSDTSEDDKHLPCCIQTRCEEVEETPNWSECCRLCRFITVLYYLNDVEEGGETAFPLADMSDESVDEKYASMEEHDWFNLSRHCHNSTLVVKPKRGTAVMWYSHYVDETGYLGDPDLRSHHGGCDVIKGTKWIANNWISGVPYEDRQVKSVWSISIQSCRS